MTTVRHDLVAVGASAGGVEALKTLVGGLPGDLEATVLLALHLPVDARSYLPEILQRRCSLPVAQAEDGMPLRPGTVVLAHPDAHLLVVDDRIVLGRGARENGSRPAHDAMLRSCALARGPRTVGVVLTGLLDDGAAGLRRVHRYGGACLVQDPATADFPSMPRAAQLAVPSARALPLDELTAEVVRLVAEPAGPPPQLDEQERLRDEAELASALGRRPLATDGQRPGEPSPYGCPDCHGVLDLVPDDGGPVPLWPDVAAAVGLDVEVAWAAAAEHRDRMGGLAVARLVRDRRLHRGRPGGAAGAPGSPGLVLRPVGGCDVPTLLSAPVLRDHLAQEDGTGLRTVAVPSRTRGWTDLARIDPAFAGAAWSATEVGRRAFSRPLLVTRDEVCQVPAPPDPAAALAAVLADPAGPDPAPHGAAWG